MKKILIFGFPHCGITVLQAIIGHIEEVDIVIDETMIMEEELINKNSNKYILCKYPFTLDIFFTKEYEDYIKIFIIRNPVWVFSSLNKRTHYNIPDFWNHDIHHYTLALEKFIFYQKNSIPNLHLIKYEDMFDNNYKKLRELFDNIGFIYDDDIFDTQKYNDISSTLIKKIPDKMPHKI